MKIEKNIAKDTAIPAQYGDSFLVMDYGKGSYIYDISGKRYLDFTAGISVNALGYGNEELVSVMTEQAKKLIHISNLYMTMPALELADELVATGDFSAVNFSNSGTEANEAALKYARLYAKKKKGSDAVRFLCFSSGFHGRTMGSLSVTPKPAYKEKFLPLVPGVVESPYNDVESLEHTLDDSFAAVIVEPVQGEGGLDCLKPEFSEALNRLCKKYDVILIADEVQTGLGRTGYLYASHALGLEPDIITLAKPLAGGLPLGATLIPEKINSLLSVGDHGSTFGGGPVTCSLALKVFRTIREESFLESVREKAKILDSFLCSVKEAYPFVIKCKGMGLLRGIELDDKVPVSSVISKARDKGLLILRSGSNTLRIAPPLTITEAELEEGCSILEAIFSGINA
ncbi:aspartate aminotransferase family protein [Spirochaetia bacterium 38H-sp]|uniref:Aspartate aminotransferase family protein n=1 Tax=Rarispira pelagica TaxID=3141764 RepID=A0ABU9U8E3_9SPIR